MPIKPPKNGGAREAFFAAVDAGQTPSEAARALGVNPSTGRAWLTRRRQEATAKETGVPIPPRIKPTSRVRAPAETMAPDDRRRALGIVRDIHATMATTIAAVRHEAEEAAGEGRAPSVDERTARALAQLARTGSDLIEAHPGLLDLARDPEDLDGPGGPGGAGGLGGGGATRGGDAAGRLRGAVRGAPSG